MPNVGSVANTSEPEPVSSDTADIKLADVGVPKKVATPVPKLVMPVPPLATGRVPVTPVDKGSPVAFVSVAEAGVPRAIALPLASVYIPLLDGYVQNTSLVPAVNVTNEPALDDDNTVVLANAPALTVPKPTSHSAPFTIQ